MKLSDIIQVTVKVEVPWRLKLKSWMIDKFRMRMYWRIVWRYAILMRSPAYAWRIIGVCETTRRDLRERLFRSLCMPATAQDVWSQDLAPFNRKISWDKTPECPVWDNFDQCWMESDDQLRDRMKLAPEARDSDLVVAHPDIDGPDKPTRKFDSFEI